MEIHQNVKLSNYTTFRIGGNARYFAVIKSEEDLKQAVIFAKQKSLSIYILGGGSNLLISDEGVDGLVLKIEIKGVTWDSESQVIVGAGEVWDDLVQQTVDKNLYGLENLSYIPGTVGASVVQNIEAYGGRVQDVVSWVEVFDIKTNEVKRISKENCEFKYKESIFKKEEGKNFVVLNVCFCLQKEGTLQFDYKEVKRSMIEKGIVEMSLKDLRNIIIEIRRKKFPKLSDIGMAGSFFKNPSVDKNQLEELKKFLPELRYYSLDQNFLRIDNGKETPKDSENFRVALAYIFDRGFGLNGLREGNVGIHDSNPLILINCGGATAKEMRAFANSLMEKTKEKTGIDIEPEVVMW